MKIVCIGRNYAEHAKELGNDIPKSPLIFIKPSTALLINDKPFYYPDFSTNIQYELEIVLKICKNGKSIQPKFAPTYYKEIGLGIDFTARDLQSQLKEKGHPWELAKGFDNSAAVGSFVTLPMDYKEKGIHFQLYKNEKLAQSGDSRDMIHDFDKIICFVSKYIRLQIGDYIFTGTPAGVGSVAIGDHLIGKLNDKDLLTCEIK